MVSIGASDEPFRELREESVTVGVTLLGFELEATLANGVDEVGQVDGAHVLCLLLELMIDRMGAVASPLVTDGQAAPCITKARRSAFACLA